MCCLVLTGHLMSQTRVISGKVTDANDNPVYNASVVVKGSSVGTNTGPDGIYTLKLPLTAKVLVFSGIGLTTTEHVIGNKEKLNATLFFSKVSPPPVVFVGSRTQHIHA